MENYIFKINAITDIIESIDDWLIFGTVQFGRPTSYNFSLSIWFELIRTIEKKSGSVWLLKAEGDNLIRNLHLHFLISSDGLKTSGAKSNLFSLKNKFTELTYKHLSLNKASIVFDEYDKQKAGKFYLSKIETDVINRAPSYFDYAGDGICAKWSSRLKKRYKNFNLNRSAVTRKWL